MTPRGCAYLRHVSMRTSPEECNQHGRQRSRHELRAALTGEAAMGPRCTRESHRRLI